MGGLGEEYVIVLGSKDFAIVVTATLLVVPVFYLTSSIYAFYYHPILFPNTAAFVNGNYKGGKREQEGLCSWLIHLS